MAYPDQTPLAIDTTSEVAVRRVVSVNDQTGVGGTDATSAIGQLWPQGWSPDAFVRTTATITTAALSAGARESGLKYLATAYTVYEVSTDRPARLRLYDTVAHRDADVARKPGTDPTGDHGVMLDVVTTTEVLALTLTPIVDCIVDGGAEVPYLIDNLDAGPGAVTVTIDYLRTI